jgi:predicted secreted hydrolase
MPLPAGEGTPSVQLPVDESPHGAGQGEWWYYSGRLESRDGRGFGIEAVIFHVPPGVGPSLAHTWIAHYGVLDQASAAFVYDQTSEARWLGPGIADPNKGYSVHTALVQISGAEAGDHMTAVMRDGNFALDLNLLDERGPIMHGISGVVPYGHEGRSFYYSRPLITATGSLVIGDELIPVRGQLWFDRQWGEDLRDPWLAWDWFSLRLDDGTRIMLYVFRDTEPTVAFGTFIPPIGDPAPVAREEFAITPTRYWTSPRTARSYPVSWEIRLPVQALVMSVTAWADDQELDTRATTLNVYWEGLCTLTGTQGTRDMTGWAYIELTNYPIDWRSLLPFGL